MVQARVGEGPGRVEGEFKRVEGGLRRVERGLRRVERGLRRVVGEVKRVEEGSFDLTCLGLPRTSQGHTAHTARERVLLLTTYWSESTESS